MYKLVIADDELEIREGLKNYFPWEQVGFEVAFCAENGQQVLEYAQAHAFDVLLCDIMMPVMNGLLLAQQLCMMEQPPIVVFLSGYREFEYAQQALRYGVSEYILKPTKFNELHEVFGRVHGRLQSQNKKENAEFASQMQNATVVETVKAYIQENYATANLNTAAAIVHMNFQYLSKLFKQQAGCLFSEYVKEVRMRQAKKLLTESNEHIYQISDRIGYTNARNFSRAFHAHEGLWPKEYRQQNGADVYE